MDDDLLFPPHDRLRYTFTKDGGVIAEGDLPIRKGATNIKVPPGLSVPYSLRYSSYNSKEIEDTSTLI